jgi:glycosyltransferase involved in cell wall biosynthesis
MHNLISSKTLTAVILTWNEEENIARTLSQLRWLEKIVVIDSGSTDKTIELVNSFSNTTLYTRKFDTHANQWNYGLSVCDAEWILSLDADYILPGAFVEEIKQNLYIKNVSAFLSKFEFCVFGKPLSSNNTTARPVLFKKNDCIYFDDGHTQRLKINGSTGNFKNKILHDDRKPLDRWLLNQSSYSAKEAAMLLEMPSSELSFTSRLRKMKILAPGFIFFYCFFVKGMIFNGWRGWHYTLQRTLAEMLVSLRLTEAEHLNKQSDITK